MEELDLREIANDIAVLIDSKNNALIRNITVDLHPADIADIIHHLRDDDRDYMFGLLDAETASDVLAELDDVSRDDLLEDLHHKRLSEIVDEMDSDDAADLVSDLPKDVAAKVLEQIDKQDSAEVRELLRHDEETAGGIMAKEFVSVSQNSTVDEAISAIRKKAEEVDDLYNIWVVDENSELKGILPLKQLLLSKPDVRVADIMDRDVMSVKTTMDQEQVVNIAKRYDLVSIPVVDEKNQLVGRITIDDLVDVMEEEASEDIQRMAGISDEEEFRETSPWRIVRSRVPWLFLSFFGEMLSAIILKHYDASISEITAAAFFIPIMMAIPGNVGIQSATIMVRGMATGEIAIYHVGRRLLRELLASLINGLIFGTLIFSVITFWLKTPKFGIMLAAILLININTASLFGASIPFILKKMKIDPAIATGPFITTSNDALGLFVYLTMVTLFLKWL
ncbi:magnesium transporter [candidate division KSB1 bacterium]|nr:magnesium transporter [candidate division KSB1 bacterium]